ncbi:uncharacterized protein LOC122019271 [Zingiber officinale]|uniref:uncharacterized protein LOC122019271 n=1 Tax=Zingiber officinale TaxID=94328 RepID=UPI001C4C287A|nr:uncharacterized protein LOC122019271 [Zingiber officinale]
MSEAQDRQKSYADRRRRPLEFFVDDHVFLRVSPTKGVRRFGLKGKLAPHYIGPFHILERIGEVAYRLSLPPSLAGVHDVFHVSMLRKYVPHPMHILTDVSITLQPDVTYEEVPVRILDRKERQLRNKTIRLVKVGWEHHSDDEATWELEDDIRAQYPHLFNEERENVRYGKVGRIVWIEVLLWQWLAVKGSITIPAAVFHSGNISFVEALDYRFDNESCAECGDQI